MPLASGVAAPPPLPLPLPLGGWASVASPAVMATSGSRRPAAVGKLNLPVRLPVTPRLAPLPESPDPEAGDAPTDPCIMSFDAKRTYFEELLTPRSDSTDTPKNDPDTSRLMADSARNCSSARSTLTQEFLLSPRAVLQAQPFAEPSPSDVWGCSPERSSSSAARAELVAAAAENRAVMKSLAETQCQLAQVQGQLATMLSAAHPAPMSTTHPVPSTSTTCGAATVPCPPATQLPSAAQPAAAMQPAALEQQPRCRRRRWDYPKAACNSASIEAGSLYNRKALQPTVPSPLDTPPLPAFPQANSRKATSVHWAVPDDRPCLRRIDKAMAVVLSDPYSEHPSPAKVAAAGAAFLAGAVCVVCVLISY